MPCFRTTFLLIVGLTVTLFLYCDCTDSLGADYYTSLFTLPAVIRALPETTLYTITGNLLGDGHIGYSNLVRDGAARGGSGQFSFERI